MNFNICLTILFSLTCLTTRASDKGLKTPPPIERIEPRPTNSPPAVIPVVDDSGSDRATIYRRSDPRGQYINLQQGSGSTAAAKISKTETTFCSYLAMNEEAITRPINTGFQSAQFTSSASTGGRQSQYHILGLGMHNRADGMTPAFIYESISGTIFTLKYLSNGPSGKGEFTVHSIPSNIVIIDKESYRGDNYWNSVSQGATPLCGRYINLVRN